MILEEFREVMKSVSAEELANNWFKFRSYDYMFQTFGDKLVIIVRGNLAVKKIFHSIDELTNYVKQ